MPLMVSGIASLPSRHAQGLEAVRVSLLGLVQPFLACSCGHQHSLHGVFLMPAQNLLRLLVPHAGEHAQMGEQLLEAGNELGGLGGSQGKPGHGPVAPPLCGAVMVLDKGNDILRDLPAEIPREEDGILVLQESVAAAHDHDHLPGFSLRDQIVQDEVQLAVPDPARLILAHAVLYIEHRVFPPGLPVIGGRRVHIAFLHMSVDAGDIGADLDIPVGHILQEPEVLPLSGHFEKVGGPKAPVSHRRHRVGDLHAVHIPEMIVEARRNAGHGLREVSLPVPLQGDALPSHAAAYPGHLHCLRRGGVHGEGHVPIVLQPYPPDVVPVFQGSLAVLFLPVGRPVDGVEKQRVHGQCLISFCMHI